MLSNEKHAGCPRVWLPLGVVYHLYSCSCIGFKNKADDCACQLLLNNYLSLLLDCYVPTLLTIIYTVCISHVSNIKLTLRTFYLYVMLVETNMSAQCNTRLDMGDRKRKA